MSVRGSHRAVSTMLDSTVMTVHSYVMLSWISTVANDKFTWLVQSGPLWLQRWGQ